MISIKNLTKKYNSLTAVDNISLEIKKGEIFGFLGPNGAGKTTTIRIMAGIIKPNTGDVFIDGASILENETLAKQKTGFIPDRPFLYGKLNAWEYIDFVSALYNIPPGTARERAQLLFNLFSITDYARELIESYSHGMKQRLVMASSLIHKPNVLIVDEPMVGLDPKAARLLKKVFRNLCTEGTTIFMSTHSLEVAEEVCDRIGIINNGKIIAVGTLQELQAKTGATAAKLESLFFHLTGDEEISEVIQALKF